MQGGGFSCSPVLTCVGSRAAGCIPPLPRSPRLPLPVWGRLVPPLASIWTHGTGGKVEGGQRRAPALASPPASRLPGYIPTQPQTRPGTSGEPKRKRTSSVHLLRPCLRRDSDSPLSARPISGRSRNRTVLETRKKRTRQNDLKRSGPVYRE